MRVSRTLLRFIGGLAILVALAGPSPAPPAAARGGSASPIGPALPAGLPNAWIGTITTNYLEITEVFPDPQGSSSKSYLRLYASYTLRADGTVHYEASYNQNSTSTSRLMDGSLCTTAAVTRGEGAGVGTSLPLVTVQDGTAAVVARPLLGNLRPYPIHATVNQCGTVQQTDDVCACGPDPAYLVTGFAPDANNISGRAAHDPRTSYFRQDSTIKAGVYLTVTWNLHRVGAPQPPPQFPGNPANPDDPTAAKQRFKAEAVKLSNASNAMQGLGTLIGAFGNPYARVVGVGIAALGSGVGLLATRASIKADDPPDANYTAIPLPVARALPQQPFAVAQGYTQAEADAFNALAANVEQQIALDEALITAINRATGARDAGDTAWQTRQVQAAQGYAGQIAPLEEATPSLLAALAAALQADTRLTTADLTIEPFPLADYLQDVDNNGLPPAVAQALAALGLDAAQQDAFRQFVADGDAAGAADLGGGYLPRALGDGGLAGALRDAAAADRAYATGAFALTVGAGVGGTASVAPAATGYAAGTVVTLTAAPAPGQVLTGWTIDGVPRGAANPLPFTVNGHSAILATFGAGATPTPAPTQGCTGRFGDVPVDDPSCPAIEALAARGVIKGCDSSVAPPRFCPGDPTLRHQMAALIVRTIPAWADEAGLPTFTDNTEDAELMTRVATLQRHGVVRGYQDEVCADRGQRSPCYGPLDTVKYGQVLLFVARAMVANGYWALQADDRSIFPDQNGATGADPDTDQQTRDHRMVVTYVRYVGSPPDVADVHAPFLRAGTAAGGWGDDSDRAWFARAFWPAIKDH